MFSVHEFCSLFTSLVKGLIVSDIVLILGFGAAWLMAVVILRHGEGGIHHRSSTLVCFRVSFLC